ncbi:MAG: hypothetical protein KAQ62_01000 [Cyclobacteriaceae bacterium]|nr:hypothetical protein [Cyclobacteriaceae bacterium]
MKHNIISCEYCGQPFTQSRRDQMYCSSKCRQEAFIERKKENPTQQNVAPTDNTDTLQLQLEIKRLEFSHQKDLEQLKLSKELQERSMDNKAIESQYQDKVKELNDKLIDMQNLIGNQKKELTQSEFEFQEKYEQDFFELVEGFVQSIEDKTYWEEDGIIEYKESIASLRKKILRGFRRINVEELPAEVLFLEDILDLLNQALSDLGKRGFFSSSEYRFRPDEDWLEEMKDYIFQN